MITLHKGISRKSGRVFGIMALMTALCLPVQAQDELAAETGVEEPVRRVRPAVSIDSVDPMPEFELMPVLDDGDFLPFDEQQAALGQYLFYDKVLSGNRNISCATCHHPQIATIDGASLGVGEGGIGLALERDGGTGKDRIKRRVSRNAQAMWNLGHKDVHTLFHDGSVEVSDRYGNGYSSPAKEHLPPGLDNVLAVQALFPLVSQFEMAGNAGENEIVDAAIERVDLAWPLVVDRLRAIPEYVALFGGAFDHIDGGEDIGIVDVGNALAAFINSEWRTPNSSYDRWRRGEMNMPARTFEGLQLFVGKGRCISCHNGALFSDQRFHALGLPPFGPGHTRVYGLDPKRDLGRMEVTMDEKDAYRFRTGSLRNVTLTAPYGHNGAYSSLKNMVRHHLNPSSWQYWQPEKVDFPSVPWLEESDFAILQDEEELARQRRAISIDPVDLSDEEVESVVMFLYSLTNPIMQRERLGIPERVPSGLDIDLLVE